MAARAIPWEQTFSYRGGSLLVTRYGNGWAIELAGRKAQASTLIGAFEALLRWRSGDEELRIVLDALEHDRRSR